MDKLSNMKPLRLLLLCYILSLGFTDLLDLPIVEKKLQLPEILFVPLFLTWLWQLRYGIIQYLRPGVFEISICMYAIAMILSASFSPSGTSWLEVVGVLYLLLVALVYKTSLPLLPKPNSFLINSIVFSGILAALFGIAGWMLSQMGMETIMAMSSDIQYPYLGHIARATGFMNSPNMLFNFLSICLLFLIPQWDQNNPFQKYIKIGIIIIGIGAILTFSKSILLLIIGILFLMHKMDFFKTKISIIGVTAISVLLFITWMVGTHVLIRKQTSADLTQGAEKAYTLSTPFTQIGTFDLYHTNYTVNKEAALEAGIRNPMFGVGPGNFNSFVGSLKEEGNYPMYFINFDPHSTYLGSFAETGIVGLLALLFLCFQIWKISAIHQTNRDDAYLLLIGMAASILFIAMDAISMDVMNFRHLWVLLGIAAFLFAKQSHDIKTVGKE